MRTAYVFDAYFCTTEFKTKLALRFDKARQLFNAYGFYGTSAYFSDSYLAIATVVAQ